MGHYHGEWAKDENEPWTPNQKAEVVRETGMPRKWLHCFPWTHEEAYEHVSGFRRTEVFHENPGHLTWDESLEDVILCAVQCIALDHIHFHDKDVRRLTRRASDRLYDMIDGEIGDRMPADTSKGWSDEDEFDPEYECLEDFFEQFNEMLQRDLENSMKLLLKNNPKLQDTKAKTGDETNPLYDKIEKIEDWWKFKEEEGQELEYKQTAFVFSEDKFNNENKKLFANKEEHPEPYKDKLDIEKNKFELLNITKTVCAFLNTDGGEIFIGVNNESGRIVGLDEDKQSRFSGDTDFNFPDHYKRGLEMKFRQIENYLPHNVRMKFCKGEFPTLLRILVTPIEPSGTPAEVKGRKKDKIWLLDKTLTYVRENDEDQKYEGGKWSRYCRRRFPQHHEINY